MVRFSCDRLNKEIESIISWKISFFFFLFFLFLLSHLNSFFFFFSVLFAASKKQLEGFISSLHGHVASLLRHMVGSVGLYTYLVFLNLLLLIFPEVLILVYVYLFSHVFFSLVLYTEISSTQLNRDLPNHFGEATIHQSFFALPLYLGPDLALDHKHTLFFHYFKLNHFGLPIVLFNVLSHSFLIVQSFVFVAHDWIILVKFPFTLWLVLLLSYLLRHSLIPSFLVLTLIHLNILISAILILCMSYFLVDQHFDPWSMVSYITYKIFYSTLMAYINHTPL